MIESVAWTSWRSAKNDGNGGNVYVIYTDFAKAYEQIHQIKILRKMKKQFKRDDKLGKWFQQYLKDRKQQILVEETTSQKSKVVSGSVLGPVLFLKYITDIAKNVTANTKIFVDDTKNEGQNWELRRCRKSTKELECSLPVARK